MKSSPSGRELPRIDIILDTYVYPVGSTYFNKIDSRNPNVILGFGTWVELGGVVLAGRKTGDDTFANTGTIGAKTHTLTVAQMPGHAHTQFATANPGTGGLGIRGTFNGQEGTGLSLYSTGSGTGLAGNDQAHPNIQPTLIGYMWERTA